MKRRLISVMVFAVLAAAISSSLLYTIISSGSRSSAKATTAPVMVAVRDLEAGALVSEADVRPAEWPVTEGSRWIAKRTDVVGRALLTPVGKDEPFTEGRLAARGAGAGLASRIPPGMRVVAVHVDELSGLSRFILAGMHVDVISTGNAAGNQSGAGMVARTILQNIEVFSTGQTVERDSKDKPAATPVFNLLVTPQQAEVLSQAMASSRIELALRNPLDKDSFLSSVMPDTKFPNPIVPKVLQEFVRPPVVATPPPAPKAPVAEPAPAPPPPPPPPVPTVEVIHGTKRTVSPVAAAGPGGGQ